MTEFHAARQRSSRPDAHTPPGIRRAPRSLGAVVSAIAEACLVSVIERRHRLRTPGLSRVAGRWFRGEYVDGDGPRKLWDRCRCPRSAARCPLSPRYRERAPEEGVGKERVTSCKRAAEKVPRIGGD